MVSGVDAAKRALVALLRILAGLYGCVFNISRDSDDAAVKKTCRAVSRKVQPDRGGRLARPRLVTRVVGGGGSGGVGMSTGSSGGRLGWGNRMMRV